MNGYSFEASEAGRKCAADRIDMLEQLLANVQKENSELRESLDLMRKAYMEVAAEPVKLRGQIAELEGRLSKRGMEIDGLRTKLQGKK